MREFIQMIGASFIAYSFALTLFYLLVFYL
ncbi:Uncharacterised protein [Actinobacillus seminis]|uniref:Uncharacterized protein n=1 Tax=Actinobacillus seminis TaxID=722 RepID=A0A380VEX3_9PAST|nr:Uncharacterised protein [Actinobacillus seminis]SUU74766.1 Uncharacterised protein [Actinobacillus seminis]